MKDPDPVLTRLIGYTLLMVIIAIVCWPLSVKAKDVAIGESRGDRVTLTDQPCNSNVTQNIKPEWRDKFKAATYYIGQKRQVVNGCYIMLEEQYHMIFEDGDIFSLPMSFFKQVKI